MFKKITLLLIFISTILTTSVFAQSVTTIVDAEVQTTYAEYLGEIPPIRNLIPLPPTDPERRKRSKLSKQAPKNFIGRGKQVITNPELAHVGEDPVRQSLVSSSSFPVEPLVNTNGLWSGFSPNDPTGDIGLDHYLQAINATSIGVYNKQGGLISQFNANTLWSGIGFSSAGDPIILFDQEVNRWVITEFPSGNQLLVAVSQTSDPLGAWDAWNFSTPSFPDYPKYGVWNNCYSVTTNEQGPGTFHAYFIDRDALLNGDAMVAIQRLSLPGYTNATQGFLVATPVDWTGLTPPASDPLIVSLHDSSWGGVPQDAIEIYSIDIDWDNPNNTEVTNTTVPTADYDSYACAAPGFGFACVPQLGGGGLDGIPELILNQTHYRNFETHESMVMTFMTDVDGNELAGVRWIEMRKADGEDWSVYQEGTFAPDDGMHRFMSSICMDKDGNIGLAYNVSSENDYVGVRFTGRRSSDPLGEMTVDEYVAIEGGSTINSGGRFGDYSHMSIDPTNDRTFWFTTEYAGSNGTRTRILAFEIGHDTTDIGPIALITPTSSLDLTDSEVLQIEVKNFGLDTQSVFQVGYIMNDEAAIIEDVSYTLYPDSIYSHTFTTNANMDIVGDYQFKIFTSLSEDTGVLNDTIRPLISKLARYDAAITALVGGEDVNCGDEFNGVATLTNLGGEILTSVTINVLLNGNNNQMIPWTGSLAMGESIEIPIIISGLTSGMSEITISTNSPNNIEDEIPVNDAFSRTINVMANGEYVTFTLKADFFVDETTWVLQDASGNTLYSGGPYVSPLATYTDEWCLDSDACYNFTIFDSGGNGICCEFGEGFYNITNSEGFIIMQGNGEFGDSETNAFCTEFECMLTLDLEVSSASSADDTDGTIMVITENENGTVQYSIDGGITYQESNIFSDLAPGDYEITIMDEAECTATATTNVDYLSALNSIDLGYEIVVAPNPTNGVFSINISGIDIGSTFLDLDVYDATGKLVYINRLTKYNDAYTGMLSLYAFPAGVYFVRFEDPQLKHMVKIVRL